MKQTNKKKVSVPPKRNGFRGLTFICSECGKMYSEALGHTCGEDEYY